jgi:hypothetical protein
VSLTNTDRTTAGMTAISARAKDAAAQAVPLGKRAGTTAIQGARQGVQGAREWAEVWAAPHMQDAIRGAREWAAPRLHDAADAVTTTVAPNVSSFLHSTADQVQPTPPDTRTGLRRLFDWRLLLGVGAAAAAAGAAAVVAMRRRYNSATADAKDDIEPDAPGSADSPSAEAASVNGRVTIPES